MNAIRCKCTCIYPNDMNECPSCGRSTFDNNNLDTKVSTNSSIGKNNPVEWHPVRGGTTYKYHNVNYKRDNVKKSTLKSCEVCSNPISIKAESCPHCGNPTGVHVCPKCSSINTKVITGTSKATSIFLWGVFAANKVVSKFECKDCGHKW